MAIVGMSTVPLQSIGGETYTASTAWFNDGNGNPIPSSVTATISISGVLAENFLSEVDTFVLEVTQAGNPQPTSVLNHYYIGEQVTGITFWLNATHWGKALGTTYFWG